MHPLYRPIVLIIWLCAVIIGMNVLALWWLQARIPATPVASSQADRTPIRLEPPPTVAPCEPTVAVNETQIAERDAVIARLKADMERVKSTQVGDSSVWQHKAEQLEHDLMELHKVAEHVLAMDPRNWQEGKLMLAHALLKDKT
jgi:hypothetical protein